MLYNWFDHPLIEAWLERQLAKPPKTTSSDDGTSADPAPPLHARSRRHDFTAYEVLTEGTDLTTELVKLTGIRHNEEFFCCTAEG